jgi:glycosyltransferase involved in cell wall biosynthesis
LTDPDLSAIRHDVAYRDAFAGTPLISVCIATYNRAQILCERAIPTILAQTYTRWETVIVGDGCTDGTAERIAALGDPRIRFYNRPVNGPYPEDRHQRWLVAGTYPGNEALSRSRGSWIAPANDDDEWTADHLAVLLAEAQRTRSELVYGRMAVHIRATGEGTHFGAWPPRRGDFAFQAALYHGRLRAFQFDHQAYEYNEPGDWNLARRMLAAGVRAAWLPRDVGIYHVAVNHPSEALWSQRARRGSAGR